MQPTPEQIEEAGRFGFRRQAGAFDVGWRPVSIMVAEILLLASLALGALLWII